MRIWVLLMAGLAAAAQPIAAVITDDMICITRKGNPGVAIWKLIREALGGKGGEAYAAQLKSADLPRLPGTVLAVEAGEYRVGITDGKTAEVLLRFTKPWKGKPLAVGTEVDFSGKVSSFAREPFRLTVEVDPVKVEVLEKPGRESGQICECYSRDEYRRVLAGEKVAPR